MAINLNKITLEKQGDSHKIDLSKGGNITTKEIIINLNWTQEAKKKGFLGSFFGSKIAVDLDLGCFYELRDGRKTVIDGLQFSQNRGGPKDVYSNQGKYTEKPWIWHTGDDRGISAGSGENILINPAGIKDLKRIIVYCFIYEGVVKWEETNAVVNIKVSNNPEVVVEMGKQKNTQKFCAIAELNFDSYNSITVRKLVTFHNGHGKCDQVYNWGLTWKAGNK